MSIDYLGTFWLLVVYIIPMCLCWITAKALYDKAKDGEDMPLFLAAVIIFVSFVPIINVVLGYLMLISNILSKLKEKQK